MLEYVLHSTAAGSPADVWERMTDTAENLEELIQCFYGDHTSSTEDIIFGTDGSPLVENQIVNESTEHPIDFLQKEITIERGKLFGALVVILWERSNPTHITLRISEHVPLMNELNARVYKPVNLCITLLFFSALAYFIYTNHREHPAPGWMPGQMHVGGLLFCGAIVIAAIVVWLLTKIGSFLLRLHFVPASTFYANDQFRWEVKELLKAPVALADGPSPAGWTEQPRTQAPVPRGLFNQCQKPIESRRRPPKGARTRSARPPITKSVR